ncbi:hypothetical protein [Microbacterium sp. JZ31]|uniref:SLAC1 family transporter n=1 Tax=Microbacterium sp. JZ31 TaxID=1906274 RepID=UPI0019344371|nr:hypothetical protein [Microbacterium sp. JZ31]
MTTTTTVTAAAAAPNRTRPALNLIGIAFGTAGLAGTWTTATGALDAPAAVGEVLWVVAAVAWVTIVVRYLARIGSLAQLTADLRSPVLGPFAALYPVVGSLLFAHIMPLAPALAATGVWVMAGLSTTFGAWFVASLLTQPREAATLHGGYLLPTVAAALLTAQSLAAIGHPEIALGYFATGILFWLLLGAVLFGRFVTGPRIPGPLLPTLAIFSAPPAVAGNAYWVMTEGEPFAVHGVLAATMVALLLPHLFLVPRYLETAFGVGFWALTFTAAASASYVTRLLVTPGASPVAVAAAWAAVVAASLLVAAVAAGSARLALDRRSHR